jgi:hypothetical protein
MADVVYRSWSLISRDLEPTQQDPTLPQPPMLTTVAIDPGGSLCFELVSASEPLSIHISITGLSAEGRGDDFLVVYRGSAGAYAAVDATWSRGQEGLNAVFTTMVSGIGDHVKLHLAEGRAIFVAAISFSSD